MKKIIKNILLLIIVLSFVILNLPLNISALTETNYYDYDKLLNNNLTPSKNSKYSSYSYVIDKYDINIVVNENNTFDITETITAYFNVSKHGIYRTIPLKNKITRLDGTTSSNRAQVTNLSVDNEYTTSKEDNNLKIQIGSASKTLTGKQTYTIKYTYNIGKDPLKDYDELYYNIIGSGWDTVIGNITFTIIMPKDFDQTKLGFSSGSIGSTDNSKVKYNIDGNTIIGSYNGILGSNEALTIRCELSEGYFVNAGLIYNLSDYIFYLIPILFLIISLFLWYMYGRDDKVIETVEFYPPDGFNSLEVGFLYNGEADNKDVVSLLIYLANKGYLEIINNNFDLNAKTVNLTDNSKISIDQKIIELQNKIDDEKRMNPNSKKIKYYENMLDIYKNIDKPIDYEQYGIHSADNQFNKRNKFLIKKLKDYDGTNINEQWFMEGLFEYGRTEVTDKMLYNNFYITNSKILHNVNNKKNKEKIFEKSSLNKKKLIIFMIIATYFLITIPPMINYGNLLNLVIFTIIFPIIGFRVLLVFSTEKSSFIEKIFGFICVFIFCAVPWIFTVLPIIKQEFLDLIGNIIGIICIVIMTLCFVYFQKRTKYGNEMLGKLKGFKNFLETVEKEKLEVKILENPNYFYDILPFAYVLGVSDKWIKKFESILLCTPFWYDSPNTFNISEFWIFIDSAMSLTKNAMSSGLNSKFGGDSSFVGSSDGGSSSGGSSDGGSGGGGGGSW